MRAKGLPAPSSVSATGAIQPPSPTFRSNSDVSYCFAHVPEIFFSPKFSLKHTDIFSEPPAPERFYDAGKDGGDDDDDGILERVAVAGGQNPSRRSGSKASSSISGGGGGGGRSGALYTVDLDDDMDDATDQEGSNSSPDLLGSRHGGRGVLKGAAPADKYKGLFNMDTARVLTSYLDLVEVALLRQIISRSPSFFRALDDINCLHSYVSRAAVRVIHIRRQLRQTKDGEVACDIRIPKLERRRRNEVILNEKIQSMQR
jgi:hypothetical protein